MASLAIAGPALLFAASPPAGTASAAHDVARQALKTARSWGYQLQNIQPLKIAWSGCDVVVIDYSRDGSEQAAFTRSDLDWIRSRSIGRHRIVLAYLSIGEAEGYRFYWRPGERRDWLVVEDDAWGDNYLVEYWNPDWQRIIFGSPDSYLDRIVAAGFDGVLLDRIDAYVNWGSSPWAMRRMADFVEAIGRYGRGLKNNFVIAAQNGEDLLQFPAYLRTIDAVVKEDLFYGADGDGVPNRRAETRTDIAHLQKAQRQGVAVFTVEYLADRQRVRAVRARARELDFVPLFAKRELDELPSCTAD